MKYDHGQQRQINKKIIIKKAKNLVCYEKNTYLCRDKTIIRKTMLGIDSNETPVVTGVYAERIRKAARRAFLHERNNNDRMIAARSAKIRKEYNAVWK